MVVMMIIKIPIIGGRGDIHKAGFMRLRISIGNEVDIVGELGEISHVAFPLVIQTMIPSMPSIPSIPSMISEKSIYNYISEARGSTR